MLVIALLLNHTLLFYPGILYFLLADISLLSLCILKGLFNFLIYSTKSGLHNRSMVDSLTRRTIFLRSSFLCVDLFFLLLQRRVCFAVLYLGSSPLQLSFNIKNEFSCDSTSESDRLYVSSLISSILDCRVMNVFLALLISLDRFLILALLYLLDLELSLLSSFFLLCFGQLEYGWPFL